MSEKLESVQCLNCRHIWKSTSLADLQVCPFCLDVMAPLVDKNGKLSFDFTWGLMHEDSLNKKKGRTDMALVRQAAESFYKAGSEKMEYMLYLVQFLKKYADYPGTFQIAVNPVPVDEVFKDLSPIRRLILQLEKDVFEKGSDKAGAWLADDGSKWLDETGRQKLKSYMEAKLDAANNEMPLARLVVYKDQLDLYQRIGLYLNVLSKDQSPVMLELEDALDLLQIGKTKDERLEWIQNQLDQEDLESGKDLVEEQKEARIAALLEGLYRPLADKEHAFDHIGQALALLLPVLTKHQNEWDMITRSMIRQNVLFRGIHLSLQQILHQNEELADFVQDLLQLHYEQIYMEPYDWIEATDGKIALYNSPKAED